MSVGATANNESAFDLAVQRGGSYVSRLVVNNYGQLFLQPGGGDVAVGMATTPAHKLDVAGRVNASQGLCIAGVCKSAWSEVAGGGTQWATAGSNIHFNTGNVGVGTATPDALLSLRKDQAAATEIRMTNTNASGFAGLYLNSGFTQTAGGFVQWNNTAGSNNLFVATGGPSPLYLGTNNSIRVTVLPNSGNVGLGTTSPSTKLQVVGAARFDGTDNSPSFTVDATAGGIRSQGFSSPASGTGLEFGYYAAGPYAFVQGYNRTGSAYVPVAIDGSKVIINPNSGGNVGIGVNAPTEKLHVVGNINVTGPGNINASGTITGGNIQAKYQDVAEWVPSTQELAAGTVVVLDSTRSNHVLASSEAYDTRVAGVVSARPGLILGEGGEGKVMVATTGRVKVRVDATRAPIRIGDLLVTSGAEGVAMKSEPVALGGRKMHAPGTIIGKALEPLEKGVGEILVLLSLQ
jgi:hypothetical protein